jgi:hypothetical protein
MTAIENKTTTNRKKTKEKAIERVREKRENIIIKEK